MAYSKAKFKNNGDRASPCFKPFLKGNVRQMFVYPDSAMRFSQTPFILSLPVSLGCHTQREYDTVLSP